MKPGYKTCDRCLEDKVNYQRTPRGNEIMNKSKKQWRQTPNGKRLTYAHVYVGIALKRGKLVKEPCQVCGDKVVQAHHDDHDKRLDVRWLCVPHHKEVHSVVG